MRFYNTLKRKKEDFVPIRDDEVWMYTCGPTVYDLAHIGNFRTFLFEDILRRYLKLKGYRVNQVMNITDIDDKTIEGARSEGVSLDDYTAQYIDAFFEDMETLMIERAERFPRATEHIQEMIEIISALLEKGYAYERDGSVYFDISKYPHYGMLSRRRVAEERGIVDSDEYGEEEENARDFALWKATKEGEPSWDTPFGRGRPGWHIECSAMSMKYLGESFDIHAGGVDNIFPHHENEIAQSESFTGRTFVKYWLHSEHLLVEGEKMSKSKGNYYTLRDLIERGHDPRAIRFSLATSYYKHPLNFTIEGLRAAESTLRRVADFRDRVRELEAGSEPAGLLETIDRAREQFFSGMDDDLNWPRAMSGLFEMMREANKQIDAGNRLGEKERNDLLNLLELIDRVFLIFPEDDVELPDTVRRMIEEREEARESKDYERADVLRQQIADEGYLLEDTASGVKWKKMSGVKR